MVAAAPLSDEDLASARADLESGRPVTVWFTPAAVGVPADGSAKVVSIEDAAAGDFIQVRPAGTRDTMFCSPNELTRVRPPRKRAGRAAEPAPRKTAVSPPAVSPPARPAAPAPAPSDAAPSRAVPSAAAEESGPKPEPKTGPKPDPEPATEARSERKPERPRPAGSRPAEVTVTLNAGAEGEWTVEVMVGKKRKVRPTPVQPADVAKAARALPPAVAEAIESSLEAARQRQLERVERLRAELEAAQRALRDLSG